MPLSHPCTCSRARSISIACAGGRLLQPNRILPHVLLHVHVQSNVSLLERTRARLVVRWPLLGSTSSTTSAVAAVRSNLMVLPFAVCGRNRGP